MAREGLYYLPDGRVFIDYGPVSMTITARRAGRTDADLAAEAFPLIQDMLAGLGDVLPELKKYPESLDRKKLDGVARLMADAVLETGDPLLTPMAAVAGSISQMAAEYLREKGAEKVVVNNGGDIALYLGEGESLKVGVLSDLAAGTPGRTVCLTPAMNIGGVCTSGLGGRSFTTGIASSVTVFSEKCANADALATLLADRSYIDSVSVHTMSAGALDPESDIADQQIVVQVDDLTGVEKAQALRQIMEEAAAQYKKGGLRAVLATVQGETAGFDPECRILRAQREGS